VKQKLKYIIYIITLICYFQAAFEVNNDYISNTLGDEYDTYVYAENGLHSIQKIEQHNDLVFLPTFENNFNFSQLPFPSLKTVHIPKSEPRQFYKIFLRQRKLLI